MIGLNAIGEQAIGSFDSGIALNEFARTICKTLPVENDGQISYNLINVNTSFDLLNLSTTSTLNNTTSTGNLININQTEDIKDCD